MNIHYTGRNVDLGPSIHHQVESRLRKVKKVLGPRPPLETHVILSLTRKQYSVEITVNLRDHALVGSADGMDLGVALKDALDNLERQALKRKSRLRVTKRRAHPQSSRSIRTLAVA